MTNHVDWSERAVKLGTIRNISQQLDRLRRKKDRTSQDNIDLAQLKQRRKSLVDTMRPFVIAGVDP